MDQLRLWFENKEWPKDWRIIPHLSVNQELFEDQYFRNPELWTSMFRILNETNFSQLEPGRHEVAGDDLFFMVNHYVTKETGLVQFEIHRKYIDLQYVFEGQEFIGTANAELAEETLPYNAEKDIAFYKVSQAAFQKADPTAFLLFFPEELHQPGVMVDEPGKVKKVVFKISYRQV